MNVSNSTNALAKNWIVKCDTSHTFFVYGNGDVYSRGQCIGSDSVFKINIEEIKSPLAKLVQLHGVMYNLKKPSGKTDTVRVQDNKGEWHVVSSTQLGNMDTTKFKAGVLSRLVAEREMKHIGVIAQEVEKVVPEVVRMIPDGTLSVEYYSIIGLLIEAIKEQQNMIDRYFQLPKNSFKNTGSNNTSDRENDSFLYQNAPNPFSQSTVIKYKVSSGVMESAVMIFDMQGTLLKTYKSLDTKGEITIFGNEFKPGMYLYSLIVDGNEIDTKRMILTD